MLSFEVGFKLEPQEGAVKCVPVVLRQPAPAAGAARGSGRTRVLAKSSSQKRGGGLGGARELAAHVWTVRLVDAAETDRDEAQTELIRVVPAEGLPDHLAHPIHVLGPRRVAGRGELAPGQVRWHVVEIVRREAAVGEIVVVLCARQLL